MTNLIVGLVLSIFGDDGPIPEVTLINEEEGIRVYKRETIKDAVEPIGYGSLLQIAMKSISLLMSEHTYQNGDTVDGLKYFGVIPFADLGMDGLTYFFLIPDPDARGSARATTITLLLKDKDRSFFYDYQNELRVLINEHASRMRGMLGIDEFTNIMIDLLKEVNVFGQRQAKFPLSKQNIKIIFAGLDNSGKTSMILGLEKKYSKMANIQPTKGVTRSTTTVMGMSISVWDLGGQQSYRTQYLKDAELYLYDCDLIFYLVDVRETERLEESIEYYSKILKALSDFEENPPIIICLHKIDPDAQESIKEHIKKATSRFKEASGSFSVKFFETTIFEPYTLISAFSYGLATLNPNRDVFKVQLENLAKSTGARAVILLNEKGIVLSDYAASEKESHLFELGAHHFTSLHGNLSQVLNSKDFFKGKSLYIIGDNYFSFHVLKIDDAVTLNVLVFVQGKEAAEKVESHLDPFKANVKELLDTYF